jgi:hypothetical protein
MSNAYLMWPTEPGGLAGSETSSYSYNVARSVVSFTEEVLPSRQYSTL